MKNGLEKQHDIMVAIDPSRLDQGVILFCGIKEKFSTVEGYDDWEADILTVKQQLFATHPASFYGVLYETKTVPLLWKDRLVSVAAIVIPLPHVHQLTEIADDKSLFSFHHSFLSFLKKTKEVMKLVSNRKFYPTISGFWSFSASQSDQILLNNVPITNKDQEQTTLIPFDESSENIFSHSFLQHYILVSDKYESNTKPYFSLLASKSSDPQMKEWIRALMNPNISFKLSRHLYPFCIHKWHGENDIAFQMQLVMHEPVSPLNPWKFEWFIKEWTTGSTVSVKNVMEGQHPFRRNPFPWFEQEILNMEKFHSFLPSKNTSYFHLPKEKLTGFLLNEVKELESLGVAILIPEHFKKKIKPTLHATVKVNTLEESYPVSSWVRTHVTWQLQLEDEVINQQTFTEMVEQQQQMIRLHDKWVMWDLDLANELYQQMEASLHDESAPIFEALRNRSKTVFQDPVLSSDEAPVEKIHWEFDTKTASLFTMKNHTPPLAEKWAAVLKHYQKRGVTWLLQMRKLKLGCCLADDMGLGKTLQTIAYIDEVVYREKNKSPVLVLCPSSLVHNWVNELTRFAPHLSVYQHEGPSTVRAVTFKQKSQDAHVIICSYPIAKRDQEFIKQIFWTACVFDEAQMVKNSRTLQRKAIKQFQSIHSIALTGTPVENHPLEIWSLMDLLNPGFLKDEEWFYESFLQEKNEEKKAENLAQLSKMIKPFMLRRSKETEVKELAIPKKTMIDHPVSLTEEQVVLYEAAVEEWTRGYDDISAIAKRALLFKTMTKLKQICNHPGQLFQEENDLLFEKGRSNKWDLAVSLLEGWLHQKKRGLIFTQYRFVGRMIQRFANARFQHDIPFFHGGLNSKARQKMILDFQTDHSIPFMVISLRAGGFGMNLTEATEVLHFDRWWNPAVEAQATDRVHRIGQLHPVTVHTITVQRTIEERISQLIQEKKKLQKALIHGRPLPIWDLSREEIAELFSL